MDWGTLTSPLSLIQLNTTSKYLKKTLSFWKKNGEFMVKANRTTVCNMTGGPYVYPVVKITLLLEREPGQILTLRPLTVGVSICSVLRSSQRGKG